MKQTMSAMKTRHLRLQINRVDESGPSDYLLRIVQSGTPEDAIEMVQICNLLESTMCLQRLRLRSPVGTELALAWRVPKNFALSYFHAFCSTLEFCGFKLEVIGGASVHSGEQQPDTVVDSISA